MRYNCPIVDFDIPNGTEVVAIEEVWSGSSLMISPGDRFTVLSSEELFWKLRLYVELIWPSSIQMFSFDRARLKSLRDYLVDCAIDASFFKAPYPVDLTRHMKSPHEYPLAIRNPLYGRF